MKKLIVMATLLFIVPVFSGCVIAERTRPVKETKVIVVPGKKKPPKKKHHEKKHHGKKSKHDKIAICHKGKTKMVKEKKLDKYLKKGATLGSCY